MKNAETNTSLWLSLILLCVIAILYFISPGMFRNSPAFYILIFLGSLNFFLRLFKKITYKPSKVGVRWKNFWIKYNLKNQSDEYIHNKIIEIADVNSDYPEEDKKFAQQLRNLKRKVNR